MKEPIETEVDGHSKYSPSSIASYATCPGYRPKEKEEEESEEPNEMDPASVGSRIHEALENDDPSTLLSSQEKWMYDKCKSEMEELIVLFSKVCGVKPEEIEVIPEHKFPGINMPIVGTQTGTTDVLLRCGEASLIADYKTGMIEVGHPKTNSQTAVYSLYEFSERPECNMIIVATIQPQSEQCTKVAMILRNNGDKDIYNVPGIPMYENGDMSDISLLYTSTIERAERLIAHTSEYRVSPDVCVHCGRLATCPNIAKLTSRFGKEILHLEEDDKLIVDMDEAIDSPENIGRLMSFYKIALESEKEIKKIARGLFNMNVEIPGWKASKGARTISVDKERFKEYVRNRLEDSEIVEILGSLPVGKILNAIIDKFDSDMEKDERNEIKDIMISDLEDSGVVREVKTGVRIIRS